MASVVGERADTTVMDSLCHDLWNEVRVRRGLDPVEMPAGTDQPGLKPDIAEVHSMELAHSSNQNEAGEEAPVEAKAKPTKSQARHRRRREAKKANMAGGSSGDKTLDRDPAVAVCETEVKPKSFGTESCQDDAEGRNSERSTGAGGSKKSPKSAGKKPMVIDDVMVISGSVAEHLDDIETTKAVIRARGFFVDPDKCEMFQTNEPGKVVSIIGIRSQKPDAATTQITKCSSPAQIKLSGGNIPDTATTQEIKCSGPAQTNWSGGSGGKKSGAGGKQLGSKYPNQRPGGGDLDDIVIVTEPGGSEEEHIYEIGTKLEMLRSKGLHADPSKLKLCQKNERGQIVTVIGGITK